jgi:acyl carrier protein
MDSASEGEEILEEIRRIAREELEIGHPLSLEDELSGRLALDSMQMLTLAVRLENHFLVKLREEDSAGIDTVGDLVALVARRMQEARP